jgi:hypothetical protein
MAKFLFLALLCELLGIEFCAVFGILSDMVMGKGLSLATSGNVGGTRGR